jgi:hypothetical protein
VSDQEQLFDPARYSPASVAVLMRLPASNARAFVIASALGSIRGEAGHDRPLRSGKDASGTLITSRKLKVILAAIGINRRQWQKHLLDWEARYVAHHCARDAVFLFVSPNPTECPMCHREIEYDHKPPPIKQSPRGAAKRTNRVTEGALIGDFRRRKSAPEGVAAVRQSEREPDTPSKRFLQGLDSGVGGLAVLEGLEVQEVPDSKAVPKFRRAAKSDDAEGEE